MTLFDANHCVGAVMFLFEGDGKAVLYTGDIRAETWWVNSLVQNPTLLPYTLGSRRLDCIYLDTTFATKSEPYREFPSKADGIRELLHQVGSYPTGTIFYFHSWTFGYENVWIALSNFLQSPIHLDEYRYNLYESLSTLRNDKLHDSRRGFDIREAAALCGFRNGNHIQPGCLIDRSDVRLHSCERGMGCPIVDQDSDAQVVHIIPIVTRNNGTEIAEVGAGGGKGDLDQKEELDTGNLGDVTKLMELCTNRIEDKALLSRVLARLQLAIDEGKALIDIQAHLQNETQDSEDVSLQRLVTILSSHEIDEKDKENRPNRSIRFPYSRHSSYSELCFLVDAFHPKDVFPCTVDEVNWNPSLGMRPLFGKHCSADIFRHDEALLAIYNTTINSNEQDTQQSVDREHFGTPREVPAFLDQPVHEESSRALGESSPPPQSVVIGESSKSKLSMTASQSDPGPAKPLSKRKRRRLTNREIAYKCAAGLDGYCWADYGGLVSTRMKDDSEEEL